MLSRQHVQQPLQAHGCFGFAWAISLDTEAEKYRWLWPCSPADEHAAMLQGGRMSCYLESLKINDTIDVKGPLGHFVYYGKGKYRNHGKEGKCTEMSMIAGGTGITPMYQVIQVGLGLCLDIAVRLNTPELQPRFGKSI